MDSWVENCYWAGGMDSWAAGWRVLYGVGRVPLFRPDCRPLPSSRFFQQSFSLVLDKSCSFFFFCSIYIYILYMGAVYTVHAPFCSLRLWRVQFYCICYPGRGMSVIALDNLARCPPKCHLSSFHTFHEHVQAIWKVLFLFGLINRVYWSCIFCCQT